jgi:uncharacterized OB-fold protein
MTSNESAFSEKPRPPLDSPEKPFWDGLREGEIRVQRCDECGRHRFPASRYCPHCRSAKFHWSAVEGFGEVESFCVFHKAYFPGFASEIPYAVIQVKLDSGVRFFSNPATEADKAALTVGMQVRAVFDRVTEDLTLLKFTKTGVEP